MIRRNLVSIFVCILLSAVMILPLCSCGSETAADGAYTPVKDENGSITGYERKYHNDNGDITRWDVYDANEQYDHYILYEYDSDGNLAKETYYRADGIGVYYYAYSYTDDGVLAEMDYASAKEGSTRTQYDSEGKELKRYSYDNKDEFFKYEEFINGKWVEKPIPTDADASDGSDESKSDESIP